VNHAVYGSVAVDPTMPAAQAYYFKSLLGKTSMLCRWHSAQPFWITA
ncbi:MAG: hypothetical protein JO125_00630, partial [Chloroflexi bacterium]|nr:hypothetical protein [Chloroflexota bacterium]